MNTLLIVIITVLAVQAVFTIVLIVADDEDIGYYIICGIWLLLLTIATKILHKIHLIYCRKKYNIYMFYFNGQPTQGYYMTKKMAQLFKTDPEEKYSIELWKEGKNIRSVPYKNQVLDKKKLDKDSIKPYLKTRES